MVDDGGQIQMDFSAWAERGAFVRGGIDRNLCGHRRGRAVTRPDRRCVWGRSGASGDHFFGEYGAWVSCAAGWIEPAPFLLSFQQADGRGDALSCSDAAGADVGRIVHHLCAVAHNVFAANVSVSTEEEK